MNSVITFTNSLFAKDLNVWASICKYGPDEEDPDADAVEVRTVALFRAGDILLYESDAQMPVGQVPPFSNIDPDLFCVTGTTTRLPSGCNNIVVSWIYSYCYSKPMQTYQM